mmetsp:Transcript_25681/g.46371  ORF Transcript_25681/g.46371 Transcript_25681/m.46371 type:complete len:206 (+) Transcript_25681:1339-1956(+)
MQSVDVLVFGLQQLLVLLLDGHSLALVALDCLPLGLMGLLQVVALMLGLLQQQAVLLKRLLGSLQVDELLLLDHMGLLQVAQVLLRGTQGPGPLLHHRLQLHPLQLVLVLHGHQLGLEGLQLLLQGLVQLRGIGAVVHDGPLGHEPEVGVAVPDAHRLVVGARPDVVLGAHPHQCQVVDVALVLGEPPQQRERVHVEAAQSLVHP